MKNLVEQSDTVDKEKKVIITSQYQEFRLKYENHYDIHKKIN